MPARRLPAAGKSRAERQASFSASVVGSANTGVTWSVREANGGAVSASGAYTAPNRRGLYHVVATSAADPSRHAEATVTVTSGAVDAQVN